MINNIFIKELIPNDIPNNYNFDRLGLLNSQIENTLSFLDDPKFLSEAIENKNVSGLITSEANKITIEKNTDRNLIFILSTDPRWDFYNLYNRWVKTKNPKKTTQIASSAIINSTAFIAEKNVLIGENTIVGPHVTILENVTIGDYCVIKPGAVIGTDGFEHKKTTKGIISVTHDGTVKIGNYVEIGANTCIDKGFSFKDTIIEDFVKIDNLVHIAHCVHVKQNSFIIANAMIGGSTVIGENSWVAPSASLRDRISVGNNSVIGLGSVVTKSVPENEVWAGNPAKKFK